MIPIKQILIGLVCYLMVSCSQCFSQNRFVASVSAGSITTTENGALDFQVFGGYSLSKKVTIGLEGMYAKIDDSALDREMERIEIRVEFPAVSTSTHRPLLSFFYGIGAINITSKEEDDFTLSTTMGLRFYALNESNFHLGLVSGITYNTTAPFFLGNVFVSFDF